MQTPSLKNRSFANSEKIMEKGEAKKSLGCRAHKVPEWAESGYLPQIHRIRMHLFRRNEIAFRGLHVGYASEASPISFQTSLFSQTPPSQILSQSGCASAQGSVL